ncbi:hypothetical protein CLV75_2493 [Ruegeria conchae]|uniref:Uncharacterized protein n=1 Tax=Ruegeria conchae TaxID=981384 RepID=A0A497ZHV0_9RHOB|nr:hypothetical protein CLV75_2493 [Ruegeria conchae]
MADPWAPLTMMPEQSDTAKSGVSPGFESVKEKEPAGNPVQIAPFRRFYQVG